MARVTLLLQLLYCIVYYIKTGVMPEANVSFYYNISRLEWCGVGAGGPTYVQINIHRGRPDPCDATSLCSVISIS